ncbi:fam-d protein [Plasmodium chabaudi chabaudi]|uniref:Fam-d protein n=1 Tax=Plasmodium chabaudi chabaudi TaxID=31271 RepID=A0A4V0K8M7_PLACU|nr:fam-d protein [Plasmodium chabaudi chabaudi]VTZ68864.1 fam-d protein [Plasmodium chabaudi chabaudi]|eukprot:XP_016655411.1 fam-d protein [Plasmodium chabaudi chabaudi]
MRNIILSFFMLVIFSNVKAATLQDANNNSTKLIAYNPVDHPTVTFEHDEKEHIQHLDIINCILNYESENTKYAYQCNNYHWVITDFDISINNSTRCFKKKIFYNKKEGLIKGTSHFISYIKEKIKCLVTQHIHKYDFENNYDDNLKKLANDLKALIYDKFDYDLRQGLICSEGETANKKFHNQAKEFFKALVHNSNMMIKGYFIKIGKDGNYTDSCQNKSLYFNISICRNNANANYDFKPPKA